LIYVFNNKELSIDLRKQINHIVIQRKLDEAFNSNKITIETI